MDTKLTSACVSLADGNRHLGFDGCIVVSFSPTRGGETPDVWSVRVNSGPNTETEVKTQAYEPTEEEMATAKRLLFSGYKGLLEVCGILI